MKHCNSCAAETEGKYCSNCGQAVKVGRLHMHDVWHELWHGFTHTDKGILKLIKDLFFHPGTMYHNYFRGQRKIYFSPVLFYILTAGLSIYVGDQIFHYEDHVNHNNNEFGKFVLDHTKLLGLFLLPVEALLTYVFFRKHYNLAECAVFWLFCNGLVFTFKVLSAPVYIPLIQSKSTVDYWIGIIGFCIMLWQLCTVFARKRGWRHYLLCILLVNLIIVLYQYAGYYFIFENETFNQPVWKMLKEAYTEHTL